MPVWKLGNDTHIGNREWGVGNGDLKFYSQFPFIQ